MKASGYTNKAARSSIHIIASKSRETAPAAAREVNKLHPKIIEIKPDKISNISTNFESKLKMFAYHLRDTP
jgi:hypothetical protein